MWRKLLGLALGLEILAAMLLSTATPGAASAPLALVSDFNNPLEVTSVFGETTVPQEITVNSGEEMHLASHEVLAPETIHFKPLKNSANSSAAFDTFHAGFDNQSDTFCDLPLPEDSLNEAHLHSHYLAIHFLLKDSAGQAGLIECGNGFVQKTIFCGTLLDLPGCSITEIYLTCTVTAGASTIVANQLFFGCNPQHVFLSPAFPQVTPINKALLSLHPLEKQSGKLPQSGMIDFTLTPAAIPTCLPKLCWLNLAVPPAQGRQGLRRSAKVNRKDLII